MPLSLNSNKSPDYAQRFAQINDFLLAHQSLWQQRIYVDPEPCWQQQYPALVEYLLGLDETQLQQLQSVSSAVTALSTFVPGLAQLPGLLNLARLSRRQLPPCSRFFEQGIPGRKWQQLQAFSQHCQPLGQRYIDWCCGKAHLGRYVHALDQLPVLGYEWQQDLVSAANQLAADSSVKIKQADVLESQFQAEFKSSDQVLALHACGDLHRKLLNQAVQHRVKAINLAPCCFQKTTQTKYRPMSALAQQSSLQLSRECLHTAVQETVTAGAGVDRRRKLLQAWRLGFDCWQRQHRGVDQYLNVPALPQSCLHWGFEAFCLHLAQVSELQPQANTDWQKFLQLGQQRFEITRRLDVARQVFRRAIELWLVLDQVLYLQQYGYQLELGEFCESSLSPRNLMLSATLNG